MSNKTIITGFDPEGIFGEMILPLRFRKRQKETRFKQEWRLTLAQYAAMMREFKGPRKQRGIIAACAAFGAGGSVVLTTQSYSADGFSPGTVISGVRFDTDGTMVEIDSETGNVDETGEWWSDEPQASIGDGYEVQALSSGKTGTWSTSAAADDTWITITANRQWDVQESGAFSAKSCTATFEIGLDGVESALDSAAITCVAANDL